MSFNLMGVTYRVIRKFNWPKEFVSDVILKKTFCAMQVLELQFSVHDKKNHSNTLQLLKGNIFFFRYYS